MTSENRDRKATEDDEDLPELGSEADLELEEEDDGAERRRDPLRRPA
jgi:hypothetical protein